MKILVIRFSSIGDIVLCTPVLRAVKKQYPQSQLHFLTKEENKYILEANPHIDRFYTFEGDLRDTVFDLLKEKYDYIIDLHNNFRSGYVKSMLRQAYNTNVKIRSVKKLNIRKILYSKLRINTMPDKSIVDRYFNAAKHLRLENDGEGLEYHIPEDSKIENKDLPMSHSAGYISFVIGGAHNTKKMPIEKWKALCAQVEYPIILQGGAQDEAAGNEIMQVDPIRIYNSCGKFSLHESADIIRFAKVVVTHDTGLMHIAAAFKRKIISIWGNTTPWLGMFPYYGHNNLKSNKAPQSVLIEESLGCRPCSKIGHSKCPKGHFKCMQNIDLNKVEVAVKKYLA